MPPKGKTENDEGLLEYLEDIIGSNSYVEPANLAAEKVEQLTEVRQEKLNRVKAAEKEKDGLAGAKAEAEALVSKDREIRRKRNVLFQIHGMHARREGEEASEQRGLLSEKLDAERLRLSEADERVAEIENGMSDQKKECECNFGSDKTSPFSLTPLTRRSSLRRADRNEGIVHGVRTPGHSNEGEYQVREGKYQEAGGEGDRGAVQDGGRPDRSR